jgi:hypothetical protein
MNRLFVTATLIAVALGSAGCGEGADEAMEALSNMKTIVESVEDMKDDIDLLEQRRKERVESGDTLALTPDDLKVFLPDAIDGFESGELEYQTMDMQGMSWTEVERDYTMEGGKSVKVKLVDYNNSAMGWMGASAMFRLKFRTDNNREMSGTFETDNEFINGFEKFQKKQGRVNVTYGLGGRFLLTIQASDQESTDWVKSLAASMKLDDLAAM